MKMTPTSLEPFFFLLLLLYPSPSLPRGLSSPFRFNSPRCTRSTLVSPTNDAAILSPLSPVRLRPGPHPPPPCRHTCFLSTAYFNPRAAPVGWGGVGGVGGGRRRRGRAREGGGTEAATLGDENRARERERVSRVREREKRKEEEEDTQPGRLPAAGRGCTAGALNPFKYNQYQGVPLPPLGYG